MPDLAVFDLDYTLTKRGTWGRFVVQAVKFKPHIWLPLAIAAGVMQWKYKCGYVERIRVKQAMMRWAFRDWPKERVISLANDFAAKEVKTGLRPGALRALEHHQQNGDTIFIASAAVDVIVSAISVRLGVQHWVATDMAWKDGKLSEEFASANCYGDEKLRRFKAYLDKNPDVKHNHTNITMYSDSYSDLAIMQAAHVGIAVNPDKRLQALAKEHNFAVVDWMV